MDSLGPEPSSYRVSYRVHGLSVSSDPALAPLEEPWLSSLRNAAPGLPAFLGAEVGGAEAVDVSIEVVEGLEPREGCELSSGLWWQQGALAVLDLPCCARFEVRGGSAIHIEPRPGIEPAHLAAVLWTSVWPVLLTQRGLVVLRGTAVTRADGTLLLVGRPGAGKSLAAAWLAGHGFELVADDHIVLHVTGHGAVGVEPGLPRLRLWPKGLGALGWEAAAGTPSRPGLDARDVTAPLAAVVAPVRWVIDLETLLDTQQGTVRGLGGRAAFSVLLAAWPWDSRADAELRGRALAVLTRLLASASVWSLHRVTGRLEATWERLQQILADKPAVLGGDARPAAWRAEAVLSSSSAHQVSGAAASARPGGYLWLVSYPKSGNTWMRALLASYEADADIDLNALPGWGKLHSRTSLEQWSGMISAVLSAPELAELRAPHARSISKAARGVSYVKLHNACVPAPRGGLQLPVDAAVGVVYLVRNPLDIVSSFAHHLGMTKDEVVGIMGDEYTMLAESGSDLAPGLPQPLSSWSGHVRSWLGSGHRLLLVRYEDLLDDTACELERVLEFMGVPHDPERAGRAVQRCRFEHLQGIERRDGFVEMLGEGRRFFREGRAGGWRSSLQPAQVDRVVHDHGDLMRELGYPLPGEPLP